jgi:hypothetical protein
MRARFSLPLLTGRAQDWRKGKPGGRPRTGFDGKLLPGGWSWARGGENKNADPRRRADKKPPNRTLVVQRSAPEFKFFAPSRMAAPSGEQGRGHVRTRRSKPAHVTRLLVERVITTVAFEGADLRSCAKCGRLYVARPVRGRPAKYCSSACALDEQYDRFNTARARRREAKREIEQALEPGGGPMNEPRMLKVAELWERTSQKTGKKYLSGYWGNCQVLLFDGGEKDHPTRPGERVKTWTLLLQEKNADRRPQSKGAPARRQGNGARQLGRQQSATALAASAPPQDRRRSPSEAPPWPDWPPR